MLKRCLKVVEAYEVLSDPYKKQRYDNSVKHKLNFNFNAYLLKFLNFLGIFSARKIFKSLLIFQVLLLKKYQI